MSRDMSEREGQYPSSTHHISEKDGHSSEEEENQGSYISHKDLYPQLDLIYYSHIKGPLKKNTSYDEEILFRTSETVSVISDNYPSEISRGYLSEQLSTFWERGEDSGDNEILFANREKDLLKLGENTPDTTSRLQSENLVDQAEVRVEQNGQLSNLEKSFENKNMWQCFQFCYLFPNHYEFDKDDLVQLWTAEGFIPPVEADKNMEDTASAYFDALLSMSNFQFSRLDSSTGRPRYKLNTLLFDSLQEGPNTDYCRIEDSQSVSISENTLHSSLLCDEIKPTTLKKLYQSKKLCTLLLLHNHQSRIRQIPQDFFQRLRFFRVLDLSRSSIIELPSSIRNLKELRYLNLSMTQITMLPESICTLLKLQTLKLKDCAELNDLPKDMRKLRQLRHLDLDVACLMATMPPGLGDLKELQSLPAFVVGKKNGYHITELKHMMNLRGTLRILRLESVSNSQEVNEAELYKKKDLEKLELQWTVSEDNFEVLEDLRPPPNLKELQIVGYGAAQFPQWVGDSSFSPNLVTLTLFNCGKCELLPPLGNLPFLKHLFISEMCSLKTIDNQLFGRDVVANSQYLKKLFLKKVSIEYRDGNKFNAFPSLETLKLSGMPNLENWIGVEKGDFPLLHKLNISSFTKLTSLPDISLFKSLQELEITLCPSLRSVSNKKLPASLESFLIIDCPLLKEHCRKKGRDWNKVSHIPNLWIDYQQIL